MTKAVQRLVTAESATRACVCRDNKAEGKELLLASLHAFPCNWSAWLALAALRGSAELDADAALPRHWMRSFFLAHVCVEGQENEEALGRLSVRDPLVGTLAHHGMDEGPACHAIGWSKFFGGTKCVERPEKAWAFSHMMATSCTCLSACLARQSAPLRVRQVSM